MRCGYSTRQANLPAASLAAHVGAIAAGFGSQSQQVGHETPCLFCSSSRSQTENEDQSRPERRERSTRPPEVPCITSCLWIYKGEN